MRSKFTIYKEMIFPIWDFDEKLGDFWKKNPNYIIRNDLRDNKI